MESSRIKFINLSELKVIILTPLTFNKMFSLRAVHFQVDNTTALSYLMRMGVGRTAAGR